MKLKMYRNLLILVTNIIYLHYYTLTKQISIFLLVATIIKNVHSISVGGQTGYLKTNFTEEGL